MKQSPLVIAALFGAVAATANPDVADAQAKMHSKIKDMVNPERIQKFNNDLMAFDESVRAAGQSIRSDFRQYDMETRAPKMKIDEALYEYIEGSADVDAQYGQDWKFAADSIGYKKGEPNGEGALWMNNPQKVYDNFKATHQVEEANKARLGEQVAGPNKEIQAAKAQFEKTAKAEWPARFQAVENNWKKLGQDFQAPQSLAVNERAVVKANVDNVLQKEGAVGKAVFDDGLKFYNDTIPQRAKWGQEVETFMKEKERINKQYEAAWNYEMDNMDFTEAKDGKVSFNITNKDAIVDKWADTMTEDTMAKKKLTAEFKAYQASIKAQKQAFVETAKAQWPDKFKAYGNALKQFDKQVWGFDWDDLDKHHAAMKKKFQQPHSLITNEQQDAAMNIRNDWYADYNDRLAFDWQMKKDLKEYVQNTNGAREKLKKEAADWQKAGGNVMKMYKHAWDYNIKMTKYTPATKAAPAHVELQNPKGVSDQWRAAAQADENLGNKEVADIENFIKSTSADRTVLKNQINNKWIPDMNKIHAEDVKITEEIMEFPWGGQFDHRNIHKKAYNEIKGVHGDKMEMHKPNPDFSKSAPKSLLAVGGYNIGTLSTAEASVAGVAILLAMVGVAHLSNKRQAKGKTIEFDMTDLEMNPKKESKKQIKKTLKSIMKQSNTKVTLMDN